jgi:hypothetical protein
MACILFKFGGLEAGLTFKLFRLPSDRLGMIIDKGHDFPQNFQKELEALGPEMWMMRDQPGRGTTRALNSYRGQHRRLVPYSTSRSLTS